MRVSGRSWTPERAAAAAATLRDRHPTRIALISPPRTGSTPVARLLWRHSAVAYHCHEPFEACYWTDGEPTEPNLSRVIEVDTGVSRQAGELPAGAGGLVLKEMSFQLDPEQFLFLAGLATLPVLFVLRDPRLATTSRLRIVSELSGGPTFPPFESGWPSLAEQVRLCAEHGIAHVIVDATDLRAAPGVVVPRLLDRLGLPAEPGLGNWEPRPGLELCVPEVGALMSDRRTADDPFYRRVLGSSGVQPPDEVDWVAEEAAIRAAGLAGPVAEWLEVYAELRASPGFLAVS